jgi:hypothetical protein
MPLSADSKSRTAGSFAALLAEILNRHALLNSYRPIAQGCGDQACHHVPF